jgi:hypothetical protein
MIIVEATGTCDYCKRIPPETYCGNCDCRLCQACNQGLQCKARKCSKAPSGRGVR